MNPAQFDVRRITLDNATDREVRELVGHVFQVVDASGSAAALSITINEPDARSFPVKVGFGWQHSPFTRIYISNAAQPGEWVDVLYGGDPLAAKPELFQAFGVSNASAVTIEGQTADLTVDIAAQTLGRVSADAYQPKESLPTAKYITGGLTFNTTSTTFVTAFTVPAGKRWFIRRGLVGGQGPAHVAIVRGAVFWRSASADQSSGFGGFEVFSGYDLEPGDLIQIRTANAAQVATISLWSEEY